MKLILETDKDAVSGIFLRSIYRNEHPGWFDIWNLPEINGSVFLDETEKYRALLGFQRISQSLMWLHSFFCDRIPSDYDLGSALRACGVPRGTAVYTISSHIWYAALLERFSFRKCDEIIQFETENIRIPSKGLSFDAVPFGHADAERVRDECEPAFPPLWQLHKREFSAACEWADLRLCIRHEGSIAGYILAEIVEGNCHISRLAVAGKYQHLGAASALVRNMIYFCRDKGISSFSVNTNSSNTAAAAFYDSLNLKQTGKTFPVYYKYI